MTPLSAEMVAGVYEAAFAQPTGFEVRRCKTQSFLHVITDAPEIASSRQFVPHLKLCHSGEQHCSAPCLPSAAAMLEEVVWGGSLESVFFCPNMAAATPFFVIPTKHCTYSNSSPVMYGLYSGALLPGALS